MPVLNSPKRCPYSRSASLKAVGAKQEEIKLARMVFCGWAIKPLGLYARRACRRPEAERGPPKGEILAEVFSG